MLGPAAQRFDQLQNLDAVLSLIDDCEDAHLDCKRWPERNEEQKKVLAKAICGLTNADGGILIIGMDARRGHDEEPDLIGPTAHVDDTGAVKSRINDLVGQLVEPGIEGVEVAEVSDPPGTKSGFVIVHIPASDGPPRWTKKGRIFYQRIGSSTLQMEHYQIEERFGRRPRPKLELYLKSEGSRNDFIHPFSRWFVLGLTNVGAGISKFPSIRFRHDCGLTIDSSGLDGIGGFGIPRRPSDPEWATFRGGVDDVIYPQEARIIAKLMQPGENKGIEGIKVGQEWNPETQRNRANWLFESIDFKCEITCEGVQTLTYEESIPEQAIIV